MSKTDKNTKIFIVEDNVFYSELVNNKLKEKGYTNIQLFHSGEDCVDNLYQNPSIIILDYDLGKMTGLDVLKEIKGINPNIQVVFLSGQENISVAVNSLKYGAYDYVEKNNHSIQRIPGIIHQINKFNNILKENDELKKTKKTFMVSFVLLAIAYIYLQIKYLS